jgi:hypothetical protein
MKAITEASSQPLQTNAMTKALPAWTPPVRDATLDRDPSSLRAQA